MKRYSLGIDIGTTSVKAVLIDVYGWIVAEASSAHDLYSEYQGWAEEDPADWWRGLCAVSRQVLTMSGVDPASIAAVGVSGMVPAIVLLDADGNVLRRSIQQQDARALAEISFLQQAIDQDELYRRTGGFTNQQHVLPRLLWVKTNEPVLFGRVRYVMGSYDYMNYRLTGVPSLEINWAVESGLYDIYQRRWIPEYMELGGIPLDLFPSVSEPSEVIGEVTEQAAEATGLKCGTPVVAGSADHVASALAAGVSERGDLLVKFGGGGDVLFCTSHLETHPKMFIDYHDVPGQYLVNGCMAASGSLVKWFVQEMTPEAQHPAVFQRLDQMAGAVRPGSDGIIVLPYFLGEKTPLFDPLARGVFFGLSLHHTRGHLFRAILESVSYGFLHHVDELKTLGYVPKRIFGTNGGARSPLWRQITADVLGEPVTVFTSHPGGAMGVAYVGAMGVGLCKRWSDIAMFLGNGILVRPDPEAHRIYSRAYEIYRDLYRHLKHDFVRVSRLYG